MELRDYQEEAIDQGIFQYFETHPDPLSNPVIAMPTGTGKAVVIGGFIKRVMTRWPGQQIMMLTHVKELIEQNADKLRTMWPHAPLGIYSAGLKEKSAHMPVTFGGIQSVVNALKKDAYAFGKIDLLLIDECHLVSPNENAAYHTAIRILRSVNPNLRIIGLSATPYRLGLGMITDGGIFTDVSYDITGLRAFNHLLDQGYLSHLIPMPTETQVDTSGLHVRGGEFINSELEASLSDKIMWAAIQETGHLAEDRHHWLLFAPGIAKVELAVEMLRYMGVKAAAVHSEMDPDERDDNLARFKAGQIRALVNADILTTGFDFPALDCIVLLRATNSPGLHVQILGRGTRPFYAPGFDLSTTEGRLAAIMGSYKRNCLVLDFVGNTRRLGPINDPRIPSKKGKGGGDMPLKSCDACGCLNHISAKVCINVDCGEEFLFAEKISEKASTLALIVRDEPEVVLFNVDRVTYASHTGRASGINSLKVSYFCGVRRFTEFVCLEHRSSIIHKARKWWKERSDTEPPETIAEAIERMGTLRVPSQIRVWVNKKDPEILAALFEKEPV